MFRFRGRSLCVVQLGVAREARGRGAGRALLRWAAREAGGLPMVVACFLKDCYGYGSNQADMQSLTGFIDLYRAVILSIELIQVPSNQGKERMTCWGGPELSHGDEILHQALYMEGPPQIIQNPRSFHWT